MPIQLSSNEILKHGAILFVVIWAASSVPNEAQQMVVISTQKV